MIRVIELFAGIGSQHSALKRLGIDFEVIGIAEIDKYAIKSYEAIHGKVHNYGDISKIERLDPADFWTYSFPCQDLSVAGKQKGLGEGTRSGLLYEVERLLDVAKENDELPKYLMLENVKNLVGKKFKGDFDRWIGKLNQLGYNTYWKVLNAKHYGVPQNRERVFAISIRKDVDRGYHFPEPFESDIRLKDILEEEVEEKFYISGDKATRLLNQTNDSTVCIDNSMIGHEGKPREYTECMPSITAREYKDPRLIKQANVEKIGNVNPSGNGMNGNVYSAEGSSPTLTTNKGEGLKILQVAQIYPNSGNPQAGRIYDSSGISPAMDTCQGGNRMPKIIDDMYSSRKPREYSEEAPTLRSERSGLKVKIPQATTKGYIECSVPGVFDMTYPDSKTRRGRVQDHGEIVPTLTAASQDIMYVEPCIVASRGRSPNNPSDRTPGIPMQQRLEVNKNGVSNTITSVQKDNYVLEGVDVHPFSKKLEFRGYKEKEVSPCLLATDYKAPKTILESQTNSSHVQKDNYVLEPQYRIRKLTPKECFRLMGFTDEEFHKAEAVNSNSQLYKQAGNSIVVDVLYYLFRNLFITDDVILRERQINLFDGKEIL